MISFLLTFEGLQQLKYFCFLCMKVKKIIFFFIKYKSNQFHHRVKVKTGILFKLVQSGI